MILIVEDEENIRKLLKIILTSEGYEVDEAKDGEEAIEKFNVPNKYKLVLLDVMMPKVNGLEFIDYLREISNIPVIFLSALSDEKTQILAYKNGADGYITKPFSRDLLMSVINRFYEKITTPIIYGDLTLIRNSRSVFIKNEEIHLAAKEREILFYLEDNKGLVKNRNQILDAVWGYDFIGNDRVVDKQLAKLREKLGESSKYIKTIKSLGYKFEV
nr:response regulator transcription factor [uncultured Cetobacterium sp.]